jgi:sirohydrochlorin cobaltochelatase
MRIAGDESARFAVCYGGGMSIVEEDCRIFEELEQRLKTLLPEEYQDRYDEIQPVSMGTAGVRYGVDGKIAWDQMWGSFCDLAMAGGPPHKGTLLEPASAGDIETEAAGYGAVVAEICRGIMMVTDLEAERSPNAGWVRVQCPTRGMAGWLLRAIAMENIAVRAEDAILELPAGPAYRLHKEVKNVITVIAKTAHYWIGHMSVMHRQTIVDLIDGMTEESPLVAPSYGSSEVDASVHDSLAADIADAVICGTGLARSSQRHQHWVGFECGGVRTAVWMMRMLAAVNVVARRERTALLVPVNPHVDSDGEIVSSAVALIHRLAQSRLG